MNFDLVLVGEAPTSFAKVFMSLGRLTDIASLNMGGQVEASKNIGFSESILARSIGTGTEDTSACQLKGGFHG